jgi:hypothetical protein
MEQKMLFIVEFGKAEFNPGFYSNYCSQKPIYVVAKNYMEAQNKAEIYLENKRKNEPKKVLTEDGSLARKEEIEMPKIISIRHASEEIVW